MKAVRIIVVLLVSITLMQLMGCYAASSLSGVSEQPRYTRFNVHYYTRGKDDLIGSAVCYYQPQNHGLLPYNAQVKVMKYSKGLILDFVQSGRKVYLECPGKWINQMDLAQYSDLITATEPVTYANLTEVDLKGIAEGKPLKGMSKQGIMVALGYPAPTFTSSPEANEWFYWKNKFVKTSIKFENDKVVAID